MTKEEFEKLVEKYRKAVEEIRHITFIGRGAEVHSIAEYAEKVDSVLLGVEGIDFWFERLSK